MTSEEVEMSVVSPDVQGTVEALGKFLELKEKVLQKDDVIVIAGRKYIKRSGWRKIALAFNISTEIVSVDRDYASNLKICHVKARATAPNGRVSEEIASCDSSEFDGKVKFSIHNLETKAATRAINRAISNLVGGGEVSAEEIMQGEEEVPEQEPASGTFSNGRKNEELASSRQIEYLKKLMEEQGLIVDEESLKGMTKKEASERIEKLKEGAKA